MTMTINRMTFTQLFIGDSADLTDRLLCSPLHALASAGIYGSIVLFPLSIFYAVLSRVTFTRVGQSLLRGTVVYILVLVSLVF